MRKGILIFIATAGLIAGGYALGAQDAGTTPEPAPVAAPADKAAVSAAPETPAHNGNIACGTCHVSSTPTTGHAELKACPRPHSDANGHGSGEAADVLHLKQLSDQGGIYVGVVFPHKLHASMTEMMGGCETCHHRNPPGRILKCGECHGGPSNPVNLQQPGLKGAYHRQCLGCHREWTHETDCSRCHAKKEAGKVPEVNLDPSDIMGRLHPNIEVPDVKLYKTEETPDTPLVTFRHKEHVEAFALKCVSCHREESCGRCHDPARSHQPVVREDPHEDCTSCHEKEIGEDCTYCHKTEETKAFDHASITGHELAPYHAEVSCRRCHSGEGRFAKAETQCDKCHAVDWMPEEFDHAVTGTPMDELHKGLECKDCHTEGMGKPATCTNCHDDGRTEFKLPEAPAEEPKEEEGQ